ncbi:MAG: Ig-like domain-containing protein [Bacteroidales bacterium]|nr:Ig-like domain-containing protein [Bacteroidales bacterium]
MNQQTQQIIKFLFLALIISACATMVPPQGGPRDEDPPEVVETDPPNKTANIEPRQVKITFNEFVTLSDVQNQVLISPPVKDKPMFQLRGKSLLFDIPENLRSNTTYNIYFGSSIKDLNEGNEIDNYTYTFSTGPYLDSLKLKGQAQKAFSEKTEAGWIVMLYKETADSIPMKQMPHYIAKTDENGYFQLENLAPGSYKIFGLDDQNKNYLYDPKSEAIAFSDTLVKPFNPVNLPDSIRNDSLLRDSINMDSIRRELQPKSIHLRFFNEADTNQRLSEAKALNPYAYQFVFKYPAQQLAIQTINRTNFVKEFNPNRDTLTLFFNYPVSDSLFFELSDTHYSWNDNTWIEPAKKPDNKTLLSSNLTDGSLPFYQDITFSSKIPFDTILEEKIYMIEKQDSLSDTIPINFGYKNSTLKTKVSGTYKWDPEKKYKITLYPEAFTLINDFQNDTLAYDFHIKAIENYGNIIFHLKNIKPNTNYIVQLTNTDQEVLREVRKKDPETITFNNLPPQNYRIRIIEDSNNNDQWDTGLYLQGLQPEKSWFFHKNFNVRAKWDIEGTMDFNNLDSH